jgi:ABC-2 type transport system ATP-binding protein
MAPIIEVEKLVKDYGPYRALDGVSFRVEEGGVVGFLGVNGAGKSTLMRILAGYLAPSAGAARVAGIDVVADPVGAKRRLGYLPEHNPLYPELRVGEFLQYRARLKGLDRRARRERIGAALSRCWLEDVADRVIGQLSKGYRQRVGLAECLLSPGPLLILDEPTVGLDPNQVRETRRLIGEIGAERTVFLSTHILSEVELLCREVLIIHEGRLVATDTPQALCERSPRARVLVVETTRAEGVAEALQGLPEVTRATRDPGGGTVQRFRLECPAGREARLAVLRLFVERGWNLQDLRPEPVRLEDIFAEITGPAASAAEAPA